MTSQHAPQSSPHGAQFEFFEVGGCVRDSLLGLDSSKDVDFAAIATDGDFATAEEAFTALGKFLESEEFDIRDRKEEARFMVIRAKVPPHSPLFARTRVADFVIARVDGPSSDGRHPDWVRPAKTLEEDQRRRDFTVNSIAKNHDGSLIDPFGGVQDIENRILRFVGDPETRIREDGLRICRALRFTVTKGFTMADETLAALCSPLAAEMLHKVHVNRIRDELVPMFRANTLQSFDLLASMPQHFREAVFRDGLRLDATLRQ